MPTNHHVSLAALAVAGLLTGFVGQSGAGEPGVVRIRDTARTVSARQQVTPASASTVSQEPEIVYGPAEGYAPAGCPACENGCGYGDDGHGDHGGHGHKLFGHCRLGHWLHGHHGGHHSPDHGWGRPIKRPINELPVLYQRYWPTAWMGQPGAGYVGAGVNYHPNVYMPTDTTQLGFYYQRVPFWRPDPTRTPPVPWPAHWHLRECGAQPLGHNYALPYGYGIDGAIGFDAGLDGSAPCDVEAAPQVIDAPPAIDAPPVDNGSEVAPPPPPVELNQEARNRVR